jgi:circadian clock protein KaiB
MSSCTDAQQAVTPPETAGLSSTERFEKALGERAPVRFCLVLYVAGSAPRSMLAVASVRKLCEDHLGELHDLEVVDIYQQPALAEQAGIVAVPALIRRQPAPEITLVGDMTDTHRLLAGLGLPPGRAAGGGA